ncbi:MAG: TetR/AcrR family transcriptional regulator [Lachnospiraceae bacterium]|nr:TetR/AcrR family transcriptional regulator [Lachnospiraceae bacterium]
MSKITERALESAFIELLNEKPINKITISEITDKCGVSRMTFYYHYDDIYDLLKEILMKALMDIYDTMSPKSPWGSTTKKVFRYIKKNNKMFTNIYHSIGREHLEEVICTNTKPLMDEYVAESLKTTELTDEDREFLTSYYLSGMVAFALDWIVTGMEEDPDAVVSKMLLIIKHGVKSGGAALKEAAKKAEDRELKKKQRKKRAE